MFHCKFGVLTVAWPIDNATLREASSFLSSGRCSFRIVPAPRTMRQAVFILAKLIFLQQCSCKESMPQRRVPACLSIICHSLMPKPLSQLNRRLPISSAVDAAFGHCTACMSFQAWGGQKNTRRTACMHGDLRPKHPQNPTGISFERSRKECKPAGYITAPKKKKKKDANNKPCRVFNAAAPTSSTSPRNPTPPPLCLHTIKLPAK